MRKNSREEEGDREEEKLRLGVSLGGSRKARVQKTIQKGKEERECATGCLERGGEITGEIERKKIDRGNVRA